MSIHGLVFIIIGAFVLIISFFREQLIFFRYVGGLFLIYGTFKLVFKLITGANSKKEALQMQSNYQQELTPQQMQQQAQLRQQQTNKNQQPVYRTQTFKCRCGNDVYPNNRFCSNCGFRFR